MNYKVRLDTNELNNLGDFLINYAKSFDDKVHIFLARLAQVGIEVASVNGAILVLISLTEQNGRVTI